MQRCFTVVACTAFNLGATMLAHGISCPRSHAHDVCGHAALLHHGPHSLRLECHNADTHDLMLMISCP
eukprot:1158651-Pelagomonas_calceolata.AAC.9